MKKGFYLFFCLCLTACFIKGQKEKSETINSETTPGAPIDLTATPGNHQVTLSWMAPSQTGVSAIRGYEYQTSEIDGSFDTTWETVSGGGTSQVISGLRHHTTYSFRVRALNTPVNRQGGAGKYAEARTTVYDGSTAQPGIPTGLTVTPGDRKVTLSWTAPRQTGISAIRGYEYQTSGTDGTFSSGTTWKTVSGGNTRQVISGLRHHTTYSFRVRALNTLVNEQGGAGKYVEVRVTVYDGSTAQPGIPTGLTATPGDRKVTLSWTAPRQTGISTIRGYQYQHSISSTFQGATWTRVDNGTSQVISNLVGATTYYFRVRAVNTSISGQGGAGEASRSTNTVVYEGPTATPGAPIGLTATPGDRKVTLSWSPGPKGASEITGYEYLHSTSRTFSGATWMRVNNGTSQVVSSLVAATTYYFRVRAQNTQGHGVVYAERNAVPYSGSRITPGVPIGLTATPGNRQVTLSWTAPRQTGVSAIRGYEYQTSGTDGTFSSGTTWKTVSGGNTRQVISGLRHHTTYSFRVRALNTPVNGQGGAGQHAEARATVYDGSTAQPGIPTGLTATPGDRKVTLSWTAPRQTGVSAIRGYEYQTSGTDGSFSSGTTWKTVSGGNTRQVISGLRHHTTYSFRVRALNTLINGQGGAGQHAEARDTVYDGSTAQPGIPTGLTATPGDRKVTLSWTAPSQTGVSAVSGYQYQHSISSTFQGTTWTRVDNGTSQVISNLVGATTYYFRVRAVNTSISGQGGAGEASRSTNTVVYEGPTATPGAPIGLTATPGDRKVTLSWSPGPKGASEITGYEYQHSISSTFQGATWTRVNNGTRQVVSSLVAATTYYFRVRAQNTQGHGVVYAERNAVPYSGSRATPGVPIGLTATPGDRKVTLSWTAPSQMGVSAIRGYEYQTSGTDGTFSSGTTWKTVSGGNTRQVISGLRHHTTYSFRVRALNTPVNGQGGAGQHAEARTTIYDGATAQPGIPTGLTVTPGDRKVTLSWTAPRQTGISAIRGYEYQTSGTDGSFGTTWKTVSGGNTRQVISGLRHHTTYSFRVRALNTLVNRQGGAGHYAEARDTVYDGSTAQPGIPTGLTATPGDRKVTLSWTAPRQTGISIISGYQYQHSISSTFQGATWTRVDNGTSQVVSSLIAATTYYFRVRAVNTSISGQGGAGEASRSTNTVVYEGPTATPGAPINLTATPGDRKVTLSWSPGPKGASEITGYEYQHSTRSTFQGATWTRVNNGTSQVVSSLIAATTYYFRVRAQNTQGHGVVYAERNAVPYSGSRATPGVPIGLTATPGDRKVTLSWTAPSQMGSFGHQGLRVSNQ